MALRRRKTVALGVEVEQAVKAAFDQQRPCVGAQLPEVDHPATLRQLADEDVFGRADMRHDLGLLPHQAEAGAPRRQGARMADLLPVQQHAAFVELVVAGKDFQQGGFAGAVLADERHHLAAPDVEAEIAEGADIGKRLADAADVENRCVGHHERYQWERGRTCRPAHALSACLRCRASRPCSWSGRRSKSRRPCWAAAARPSRSR